MIFRWLAVKLADIFRDAHFIFQLDLYGKIGGKGESGEGIYH